MKKIIESRFGLAIFFVLVNLATFLVPHFWGRVIMMLAIFIIQIIIETVYDDFAWGDDDKFFNDKQIKNLSFNLSKWLTLLNFAYCSVAFNLNINSFGLVLGILFIAITLIFMLLYCLFNSDRKILKFNGLIVIPILVSVPFLIYLNFGTQFIWMPISLFFIGALFAIFDELIYAIFNRWDYSLFTKVNLWIFSVLCLIGIVSTSIQFWPAISSVLTIEVLGNALWLYLVAIIILAAMVYLASLVIKEVKLRKRLIAINQRIEAEKKLELEKAAKKEQEKKNRIAELSKIPTGHPMEVFPSDLVFIAKLYNAKELDKNFQFSKVLKVNLKELLSVSDQKKQLVYNQDLVQVLEMYNSLHQKFFADWFLKNLIKNFVSFCEFVKQYQDYKGFDSLKAEIKFTCSEMAACYPEFFTEL